LVTTLHADVDVAVSGKIAAAAAVASGKIVALDADSHRFTVSGSCSEAACQVPIVGRAAAAVPV
jgi:hypothetical protein